MQSNLKHFLVSLDCFPPPLTFTFPSPRYHYSLITTTFSFFSLIVVFFSFAFQLSSLIQRENFTITTVDRLYTNEERNFNTSVEELDVVVGLSYLGSNESVRDDMNRFFAVNFVLREVQTNSTDPFYFTNSSPTPLKTTNCTSPLPSPS